ncbi:hypothetical protein M0805_002968 [Coniferiporia weirii]|nr:hypothetical protein M0805_002968 [Coniferiporia weirii]
MFVALFFALSFTTLFSSVSAQNGITSVPDADIEARIVQLEPLEIANIVIAALFGTAFTAFAALCVLVVNRNHEHRAPFISLCIASVSAAIYSLTDIGYIVLTSTFPGRNFSEEASFLSAEYFFRFWAHSSLYLSLALVLHDRQKTYTRGTLIGRDRRLFDSVFALFATFVLIATICGSLYVSGEVVVGRINNARVPLVGARLQSLNLAYQRTIGALALYTVSWVISAFYTLGVSVYVYKSALRAGVQDRITMIMLKVMMPLSTVGVLLGITFLWLPYVFFADFIMDLFYSAMSVVLLSMGMRPEYWTTPIMDHKGAGLVKQGARPEGEYFEMEDPPRLK